MLKEERFAIGQKVENVMLEILVALVTGYHTREVSRKIQMLTEANVSLECVKILIRLAKDTRSLDESLYRDYEAQLQEIGKMLGGWMASLHKTNR